jgi:signal transduction histidine kinase
VRRTALITLAAAAAVVGIVAERQAFGWADLRDWLPDLLAGWTLVGLGIALVALRRSAGAAALLLVAGFTWFAFNFEVTGSTFVQSLAAQAAYLHRGPLFHLAVAPPAGRPRTGVSAFGVVLAWTAAVVWPLWDRDGTAIVLAVAFVAIAVAGRARTVGGRSRAVAARGIAAAGLMAVAIVADAARSIAGAPHAVIDVTVPAYAAAVALAGVLLFRAAMLGAPAALAEQVVALGRGGSRLRDALRDLLGDSALDVGFVVAPETVVDDVGRPIGPGGAGSVTTPVTVAGHEVAIIVHDAATLEDEETRSAVLAAVGLAAERSRLRAEVARQVDAVDASRRRLLVAEEEERRRLADRLRRGPGADLAAVELLVDDVRRQANMDEGLDAALARAADQLERVRPELEAPLRGLGAVDERGLVAALEELVAGLPVPARLDLHEVAVSPSRAAALWFVCSESLANAVKHADATRVEIVLDADDDVVRLTVEDDGRGGADATGSGLAGLGERVAAAGGRLAVVSPAGGGTRVVAEVPVTSSSSG